MYVFVIEQCCAATMSTRLCENRVFWQVIPLRGQQCNIHAATKGGHCHEVTGTIVGHIS